jgi:hypothetical protein
MKRLVSRVAVVAIGAISVITAVAAPAAAMPSGVGWSGSWSYTSPTALTASIRINGATLSATGVDTGNSRSFSVSLSDTSSTDGRCAYVSWYDGTLNTTESTCGAAIQFTPYGEDGDISARLCLLSPATQTTAHCNTLDIPSSFYAPYIRNAGWGYSWGYYTARRVDSPEDWGATLYLGSVQFSLFGVDNVGGSTGRFLEPYLTVLPNAYVCGSAQVLSSTPASALTMCGPDQIQELPVTNASAPYGTGAQACVWAEFVLKGHPNPHDCLTMFVPVPS